MRRSRLRAGLLVVVAIALAGIGYRVWRNVVERTPRSLAELGVELLPEVAQHIQNFHRVKVKNGHMAWEIKAEDAQYYEKDNSVLVRAPEVSVYTSTGTLQAWLTSKDGRLALEGEDKEVASVTLTGAVVVWLNDLELQTERRHLRARARPDHRARAGRHQGPRSRRPRAGHGGGRHAATHPASRRRAHRAPIPCGEVVACAWRPRSCSPRAPDRWTPRRRTRRRSPRRPARRRPTRRGRTVRLRLARQEQGADHRHLGQARLRLQGQHRRVSGSRRGHPGRRQDGGRRPHPHAREQAERPAGRQADDRHHRPGSAGATGAGSAAVERHGEGQGDGGDRQRAHRPGHALGGGRPRDLRAGAADARADREPRPARRPEHGRRRARHGVPRREPQRGRGRPEAREGRLPSQREEQRSAPAKPKAAAPAAAKGTP